MTRNDPIAWLAELLRQADETEDFDASRVALATIGPEGAPTVRFVLCREVGDDGLAFYTNYDSDKARQLADDPRAALAFHWGSIGYQVRAEGRVVRAPAERSDRYFAGRGRGSQLGAWASAQSRPLDSRQTLVDEVRTLDARYAGVGVPRPPFWGGYLLLPERMEVWVNGDDRLHDRFRFTRRPDGGWDRERLAP